MASLAKLTLPKDALGGSWLMMLRRNSGHFGARPGAEHRRLRRMRSPKSWPGKKPWANLPPRFFWVLKGGVLKWGRYLGTLGKLREPWGVVVSMYAVASTDTLQA